MKPITIVKADGEEEFFDPGKLEYSLRRAGASSAARTRIMDHILADLKNGMTTSEIYSAAFKLLKKEDRKPAAARYSVKRAVFDLGPSGFPFERFMAAILEAHGWKTEVGNIMQGECIAHEVDVYAEKDGKKIGVEVKFHNNGGIKTDAKDALYVYSRFEDLKNSRDHLLDEGWLVTNTRFTTNALQYGKCKHMVMRAWDYPRGEGVLDLIDSAQVHPLTCLTTLTEGEKRRLLENDVVLCRSITDEGILKHHGVEKSRISDVLDEAHELCHAVAGVHKPDLHD